MCIGCTRQVVAAADVSEIGLGITYGLCGCCLEINDISVSDNLIVRLTLFYNTHTHSLLFS